MKMVTLSSNVPKGKMKGLIVLNLYWFLFSTTMELFIHRQHHFIYLSHRHNIRCLICHILYTVYKITSRPRFPSINSNSHLTQSLSPIFHLIESDAYRIINNKWVDAGWQYPMEECVFFTCAHSIWIIRNSMRAQRENDDNSSLIIILIIDITIKIYFIFILLHYIWIHVPLI